MIVGAGSSTAVSSISAAVFGIASITEMPREWQMAARPSGNATSVTKVWIWLRCAMRIGDDGLRRLHLAVVEVEQSPLLVDRGDADDGVVDLELADQLRRGRADHGAVGAAHRAPRHDHLDAG